MGWTKRQMAELVVGDIESGWIVNLGIGMPTLATEYLGGRPVLVHAENGILGVGPTPPPGQEDHDLVNPGKNPVTVVPGAAFMDSAMSFALIRGGRLDLALMGAYQVSQDGDLANWRLPNRRSGAIGGAADLAIGAQRVWVMMTHTAKDGTPKLVRTCTYPLTGIGVVSRIYTDLAVMDIERGAYRVFSMAPGVTREALEAATDAEMHFA